MGKKKEDKSKGSDQSVNSVVKELEKNIFSIKFYPVAVDEETKEEAVKYLKKTYKEGNETVKQLILYMLHENISEFSEFRFVHNFEYMKMKNPSVEPAKLRMDIYKKMFNYNTSIEGIMELVSILGSLGGEDDSVKVLTYHYARLCAWESEASIMLRNSIIGALGESESSYALKTLLEYARNTDNEKTYHRLAMALEKWSEKLPNIKMPDSKRKKFRKTLTNVLAREFGGRHYG